MSQPFRRQPCCRGYTFVWVLLVIAVMGIGAAGSAQVWSTFVQRDREAELLFVGDQYARAIAGYVAADSSRAYPRSFEDLLADRRQPVVRRHLRKPYVDPMTGSAEWGIVRVAGGIGGVYSLSPARPMKRARFKERYLHFAEAATYADWKFATEAGAPSEPVRAGGGHSATAPRVGGSVIDPAPGTTQGARSALQEAPPAVVPSVQPKPAAKSTTRTAVERQCRLLARSDVTSCTAIRASRGDAAGGRCEQSAAARASTCVDANAFEGGLPVLVTE